MWPSSPTNPSPRTPPIARQLEQAALDAGVLLNAFHNRRWDADIRTLKAVVDSGELGEVRLFESRFDMYEPHTVEAGPGGGVLSDLGSHLVDQALWLFGPVVSVYAELQMIRHAGRISGRRFLRRPHSSRRGSLAPAGEQTRAGRLAANCESSVPPVGSGPLAPMYRRRRSLRAAARPTIRRLGTRGPRALGHIDHRVR